MKTKDVKTALSIREFNASMRGYLNKEVEVVGCIDICRTVGSEKVVDIVDDPNDPRSPTLRAFISNRNLAQHGESAELLNHRGVKLRFRLGVARLGAGAIVVSIKGFDPAAGG